MVLFVSLITVPSKEDLKVESEGKSELSAENEQIKGISYDTKCHTIKNPLMKKKFSLYTSIISYGITQRAKKNCPNKGSFSSGISFKIGCKLSYFLYRGTYKEVVIKCEYLQIRLNELREIITDILHFQRSPSCNS